MYVFYLIACHKLWSLLKTWPRVGAQNEKDVRRGSTSCVRILAFVESEVKGRRMRQLSVICRGVCVSICISVCVNELNCLWCLWCILTYLDTYSRLRQQESTIYSAFFLWGIYVYIYASCRGILYIRVYAVMKPARNSGNFTSAQMSVDICQNSFVSLRHMYCCCCYCCFCCCIWAIFQLLWRLFAYIIVVVITLFNWY